MCQVLFWALWIPWLAVSPESQGLCPHGVYFVVEEPEDTYKTYTVTPGSDKVVYYRERGLSIFSLAGPQRQFYFWTYLPAPFQSNRQLTSLFKSPLSFYILISESTGHSSEDPGHQ